MVPIPPEYAIEARYLVEWRALDTNVGRTDSLILTHGPGRAPRETQAAQIIAARHGIDAATIIILGQSMLSAHPL